MEMYLTGVSVCREGDITEAIWGSRVSPGTISNIKQGWNSCFAPFLFFATKNFGAREMVLTM